MDSLKCLLNCTPGRTPRGPHEDAQATRQRIEAPGKRERESRELLEIFFSLCQIDSLACRLHLHKPVKHKILGASPLARSPFTAWGGEALFQALSSCGVEIG